MRRTILAAAAAVLALAGPGWSASASDPGGQYPEEPGRYIVLVDDEADPYAVADEHARRYGARVDHVYEHAVRGYVAEFSEGMAPQAAASSEVSHMEPDGPVAATEVQTDPPWGLDRIDQADLPLDERFGFTATGAGVTAYIIDTGIRTTHADFGGRARAGFDSEPGGDGTDCNGHGTHVAGT
ncbi:MAG: protease inhibitor I9 family protein, partial [Acidimicrobiia bacterium]